MFVYAGAQYGAHAARSDYHACGNRHGSKQSDYAADHCPNGESDAGADTFAIAEPDCDSNSDAGSDAEWNSDSSTSAEPDADSDAC